MEVCIHLHSWPDLDRLARCAYALLVHLCQSHQCELLVMKTEELS